MLGERQTSGAVPCSACASAVPRLEVSAGCLSHSLYKCLCCHAESERWLDLPLPFQQKMQTCSQGTYAGVMQECMLQLKSAQAAAQQGTALQPSSDMPLLVAYSSSSLKQIGTCVRARMKLLKVLSLHQSTSADAQAAVVSYLQGHMPGCRATQGKESSSEAQEVASVHLQLIHMVCVESYSSSCCGLSFCV